jgi:hypothetical protein
MMEFMMRYMTIASGICALLFSIPAAADAGWTDDVEVVELIPTGRHYFELRLAGKNNPSGCREKDRYYINYDAPGADRMFDLFVDSFKTELRLKVYVTGICNFNGYAEISSVSASPK